MKLMIKVLPLSYLTHSFDYHSIHDKCQQNPKVDPPRAHPMTKDSMKAST